ncbi:MAG: lipopolysaccharide kinase InaA family protein [Phycisphaerae bacterium]
MATLHIHPDYAALLEANGLATFDALYAAGEASRVDGHRERSVSRLELRAPEGGVVIIYLKRWWGGAARRNWADVFRLRWPAPAAAREWSNLRRLRTAGVPVAEPVAWGQSSGPGKPRTLLAVREVRGSSLAFWLHQLTEGGEADSAAYSIDTVARATGRAIRRLHGAHFSFPDLYAKHVYLEDTGADEPRVVFIDAQRLRRYTRRRRAADLAALYATTQAPGVGRDDYMAALHAYLGQGQLDRKAQRLIRRIKRIARRIKGRGQDPHLIHARRVAPPGMAPLAEEKFVEVDGGRLHVNEAFRPVLEAASLLTLDAIMAFEGGATSRLAPGRSTVRVELPNPAGGTRALFIKRHTRVPLHAKIRRTMSLGPPLSMAVREARNIVRLTDVGIPTMRCAAIGEEFANSGRREQSCLITEEVPDAVQADVYFENTFGEEHSREAVAAKRRLIRALARLVRRFHANDFVHRDLYLCHILVRRQPSANPILHLIDLQRVERPRRGVRRRRIVKDLAALLFSSWPSPATHIRSRVFTDADRLRFAHAYFKTRRLGPDHKHLIHRVIRKARQIARHEQRCRARSAVQT